MRGFDVQIGSTVSLVQLMSMLPRGQPEPPEMMSLILKAGGATLDVGAARDEAARARRASA